MGGYASVVQSKAREGGAGATRLAGMRPPGPRPMGERASGGTPRPGALRASTLKERVGAGSGLASLSTPPALAVEWRAGADHGVATPDSQTEPTVEGGAHRWWKEGGYLRGRGAPGGQRWPGGERGRRLG
jgi:hypothetical protein